MEGKGEETVSSWKNWWSGEKVAFVKHDENKGTKILSLGILTSVCT